MFLFKAALGTQVFSQSLVLQIPGIERHGLVKTNIQPKTCVCRVLPGPVGGREEGEKRVVLQFIFLL